MAISVARIPWAAFVLALFLSAPFSTGAEKTKTINIGADVWCPINCAPDDEQQGIAIDLARRVFEPLGYRVNYVVMPWSRALEAVRSGSLDAVVGATKNDDPTLLFPKHAIYESTDDFYVAADSALTFKDIRSLEGHPLGAIQDYGYGDEIKAFIESQRKIPDAVQEVGGEEPLQQNIKKLLARRIEVVVENRPIMEYTLRRMELQDNVKRIGGIQQGHLYIAFSPALKESKQHAREYDAGIEKLRAAGVLRPLYDAYGLTP